MSRRSECLSLPCPSSRCLSLRLVPWALIAVFAAGGCGRGPADDPGAETPVAAPVPGESDTVLRGFEPSPAEARDSAPSSAAIGDSVAATDETPFAALGLPEFDEAPVSMVRLPLRIENRTPGPVVVTAVAGAEPVVLDTIEAGDALRADLEAPSTGVVLGWSAIDGSGSGERPIEPGADSVQIVRIEALSGPR